VTLVVAATGLAAAAWLPARFDNAEATERGRGQSERAGSTENLAFADNFRGGRGDGVDREKWALDSRSDDGGLQDFTDSRRNVRLDGDGNVVITARKDNGRITSAKLLSRETFDQPSGRAEARVKVADNQGIRSLFQLVGAGEVDVMDNIGSNSKTVRGAVRGPDDAAEGADHSFTADESLAEDFHTYAVEWAPDRIAWSVDGKEFFRTDETIEGPFLVALSLTVGSDRSGRPDDSTRFPQRMFVDFVRVAAEDADAPPAKEAPTTPPAAPAASPWKPFTLYLAGKHVTFKGVRYEVKATHTSLPGWEPPVLPNLFQPVK
jgi:beta-glucanase (GH16 family)